MSEGKQQQQQQTPIAEKEEEHKEGEEDDDASKQEEIQVKVSTTTNIPTSQENAVEPVVIEDTIVVDKSNDVTIKEEEEELTTKVRNAGDAFYDLVSSAIEKAKNISVEKAKDLVSKDLSPAAIEAKKDAQDIATVGESVEGLARTFENLMTEIRKQPYSEQVNLLTGYKKLLKEQINVIDSRINMTERLK